MIEQKIISMKKIADTHAMRIEESLAHLKSTFPITAQKVQNLSDQEFLYMELLTNRFSKLQDHLGANVFDMFFAINKEDIDTLTMIDKLNKLEKLGIIPNTYLWLEMRIARNIVAHEYPDNPELVADTLNSIKKYCPILISIKENLFHRMSTPS